MNCLVSIIVPTYNHEKYIRQALDSILMQEVTFPYEILIGDDSSTDSTPSILKCYHAKYPDIIRLTLHHINIGATQNAYQLLTSAKGKYLATLEGDDFWTDPCKLQKQIDFLEQHLEYIGCTHNFTLVNEEGQPLRTQCLSWVKQKECFTINDFDGITMPGQPSTFVRRNIFLNPIHDYSICYKAHSMIADRTLMLIYLCQGDFYCIPSVLSAYRVGTIGKAPNLTNTIYSFSTSHTKNDFDMLINLEQYAFSEFSKKVNFKSKKNGLFLDSILWFLKKPSDYNRNTILYIYRNLPSRFCGVSLLFFYLIKKIATHYKYKF